MNNNYKSDKVKWIIVFLSIIVLSVFVLAANTNGFTTANPYGWFGNETKEESVETNTSSGIVNEAGLEIHNTKFMKLSAMRTTAASPMANSGVTLTATILPETTTDKSVDWSVEFVEPTSSWASGKTASNYVSVVPTSDGALTATVSANEGFAAQVKIVVTARSNPEATAYCLVDYGQRLADTTTITFESSMFATNGALTTNGVQSIEAMKTGNWQGMLAVYGNGGYSYTPSYKSAFTVATTSENYTIYVKASSSFYNALKAKGIANENNDWVALTTGKIGEIYEALTTVQLVPENGLSTEPLDNVNMYNEAILASTDSYDIEIKVSVSTSYETKDYIIQCQFNRNGSAFSANSVSLSSESIIL